MDRALRAALHAPAAPDYDARRSRPGETIKDSVQIMRGCFGGCTFCSITMHQGRAIQSRSQDSILREVRALAARPDFKGTISDLGGPTANMYQMRCTQARGRGASAGGSRACTRRSASCSAPTTRRPIDLMRARASRARRQARAHRLGHPHGSRAPTSPSTSTSSRAHHVGGHLKVAPEHVSEKVLDADEEARRRARFEDFADALRGGVEARGQGAVPGPLLHRQPPGLGRRGDDRARGLPEAARLPRRARCRTSSPRPMDIATCMYCTGLDPMTMKPVETAKRLRRPRSAARAAAVLQARELTSSCARRCASSGART